MKATTENTNRNPYSTEPLRNSTIRLNYYQIADALPELIEELQMAVTDNPNNVVAYQELKIYQNMAEHMKNSLLGQVL